VGSVYFEYGFTLFLRQVEDWAEPLEEALRLFTRSAETGDCESRTNYPFNLARLYVESYLAQWLLSNSPDQGLLDRSINLYVDAIWSEERQPLSVMDVLPMGYLLREDGRHLQKFWGMLDERLDLERLPAELALWHSWSQRFLSPEESARSAEAFLEIYDRYAQSVSDPTSQPAKFYLAATKIGRAIFGLPGTNHQVLSRLAVAPWEKE
jgi:hypothetical protein